MIFRLNEVTEALRRCKRHKVFIPADPNIPDDDDHYITTVEIQEFIEHLDNIYLKDKYGYGHNE